MAAASHTVIFRARTGAAANFPFPRARSGIIWACAAQARERLRFHVIGDQPSRPHLTFCRGRSFTHGNLPGAGGSRGKLSVSEGTVGNHLGLRRSGLRTSQGSGLRVFHEIPGSGVAGIESAGPRNPDPSQWRKKGKRRAFGSSAMWLRVHDAAMSTGKPCDARSHPPTQALEEA